jgi:hypothetical protein
VPPPPGSGSAAAAPDRRGLGTPGPRPRRHRPGLTELLPELAAGLHDVLFGTTTGDLASYLVTASGLAADEDQAAADDLIGIVMPSAAT